MWMVLVAGGAFCLAGEDVLVRLVVAAISWILAGVIQCVNVQCVLRVRGARALLCVVILVLGRGNLASVAHSHEATV